MLIKAALTAAAIVIGSLGGAAAADLPRTDDLQHAVVRDPALNMDAFTVAYPAKWHYQGTFVNGSDCFIAPMVVARYFSPDGLAEVEDMPRLDWRWGQVPGLRNGSNGCMSYSTALPAKDLLKSMAGILKVEYVGEAPLPPDLTAKFEKSMSDLNAAGMRNGGLPDHTTGTIGGAFVRYRNGSFVMKGELTTAVQCGHTQSRVMQKVYDYHTCWANLRYVHAPENQFAAADQASNEIKVAAIDAWFKAYVQQRAAQNQQIIGAMQRASAAQQQQFDQTQAIQQHQHDEFLATMQRGTDMSMQQAAQIANTNHTIASDWTDYSLDRQTVRDPGTGQVSKVSSTYNYTWVDGSGKVAYQTTDPNADPNGSLKGTWTLQQKVHGDGTP